MIKMMIIITIIIIKMFIIMFLIIIISNFKKLSNCNKIVKLMKMIDKKNDNEKYEKNRKRN